MSNNSCWDILARLGPEDALVAVQQAGSSDGLATSGPDWKIERSKIDASKLFYKDQAEAARLAAIVESERCARVYHSVNALQAVSHPPPRFPLRQPRELNFRRSPKIALLVRAAGVCARAVCQGAPRAPEKGVHAVVRRALKVLRQIVRALARCSTRTH
jgi:hypothetical protein